MKLDTFVRLIKDLRQNAIADDVDPNNVVLQAYASPYDQVSASESIRFRTAAPSSFVWGNGSTYTAYDSNGNAYQAPSCGWLWSSGGRWS